ncbi:META domain-containing protein [Cellulomonas composti]|uniref:DUF306 domain-containing protein n=1 Tax=Cellulomonas composti TaxID=266130 RepID=A0A511JB67_9CELL|nr:META domain-containing protein [Cellulomonas composti]GEL95214.1 hypothetical protein CCO02nite_18720 [Cellulomonas composti]
MLRLVGTWRVTVVPAPGAAVWVDDDGGWGHDEPPRVAELTFDGDGQVYGTGGVNRVRGTFSVEGDRLTFGPMVSTLMAGPPAAMRREQDMLALVGRSLDVRPGEEPGSVELVADDTAALVLHPAVPETPA